MPAIREDIIARVRLEGSEQVVAAAGRTTTALNTMKASAATTATTGTVRTTGAVRSVGATSAVAQEAAMLARIREIDRMSAQADAITAKMDARQAARARTTGLGARSRSVAGVAGIGGLAGVAAPFGGFGALAAIGLTIGAGSQISQGVKHLGEVQQLEAQTAAAIRSTGGAAQVTAKHVDDLAVSLGHMSGTQDEVVHGAENILLTFPSIRNEAGKVGGIFDQTALAALNVSKRMGTDASTAALQIGKAINDPIRGMSALRRIGVQFTRQQEEQIKVAVASGRADDARRIVLQELNREFGHSAELAGKTLPGAMTNLGEAWEDARDKLVVGLLPSLTILANWLAVKIPAAAKITETAIDGLFDKGKGISAALGGLPGGSYLKRAWDYGNRPVGTIMKDTGAGFDTSGGIFGNGIFGIPGTDFSAGDRRRRRDAQGLAERTRQRNAVGGVMLDDNGNPQKGLGQSWEDRRQGLVPSEWGMGDPFGGRDVILVADGQQIAKLVTKAQQKRTHSEGSGTSRRGG